MSIRKSALSAAVRQQVLCGLCCLPVLSLASEAQPGDSEHEGHEHARAHEMLEEVVVQATPLARNLEEMSQSASVLRGIELDRQLSNNLGETLARMPGMANASFGENVGRPVIRGFEGSRVGVLSNNMAASDASAVSQDHAVSVEPFMADQVEVLRGPATLLYGSGSIGGVVNIVTNTIPKEVPEEGMTGRVMAQGDTAADQRFLAGRLDGGSGSFAFHVNAFDRNTSDYEIPRAAELNSEDDHAEHDEHEEEEVTGTLENSFLDNRGGALGASWIGEQWRFGASWTRYDSEYGIPGAHSHGHGEEHGDEQDDEHGENHDDAHEEEEDAVTIDLESDRYDFELVGQQPLHGFEELKVLVSNTTYEHTEFEGSEVGTFFESDTVDSRLELTHEPWGDWRGVFGLQWTDRDFTAIGEEAFVPPSVTETLALFWLEQAEFGNWQVELGLRYEDVEVEAEAHPDHDHNDGHDAVGAMQRRSFSPFSASAGAIWHLDERSHLSFRFASVTRAPSDQELFSNGPHAATQTFEVGNPDLDEERNTHFEVGYRLHDGPFTASLSVFFDAFGDYIFERDTGLEEDGLPVRMWSQQDADFYGGEAEIRLDVGEYAHGHWQLYGFADMVRAEFDDGSKVPRIPPARLGAGVEWHWADWAANLDWIHASRQDRVADYETATPGYDLLNLAVSYRLPIGQRSSWEVYAKAHNLLDEDVRNHTSFLKDQAPQIGRNIVAGVRGRF